MQAKSEADWQAEGDAQTIMQAEVIRADPKRLGAAKKAAAKMLAEEQARVKSLKKLAGKPTAAE